MKILGICYDVWLSSAAIIENGKVIAAACEERFNRNKREREFPKQSINFCLKFAGCSLKDIDHVALGWNPGKHIKRYNPRFSKTLRWRGEYLYTFPNSLIQFNDDKIIDNIEQIIQFKNYTCSIHYIDHHLAHAANAFFLSPFKYAAIFSADGRGEDETCFYGIGNNSYIERIGSILFPYSIGLFYMAITEYLGFVPHADEWKVMALGAYVTGEDNPYYPKLKKLLYYAGDGQIFQDMTYFEYHIHDRLYFCSDKFLKEFGHNRKPDEELTIRHYHIAEALQHVTEDVLTDCLNFLQQKTCLKNLVVNGGVFMNSLYNGKILQKTNFEHVFISSCPDDSGTSIGAALYVHNKFSDTRFVQSHNYYGPGFSNDEIKAELDKYNIKYTHYGDITKIVAGYISYGNIVGWFQGRMEFGQRALGNRSILCDPRSGEMKDMLNSAIKYREHFRPFAPSILQEDVADYFEIDKNVEVPFMEKIYPIKPEKRHLIPAVVHADGTGRLQTVNKQTNPLYYDLISQFKRITGIPVILNTSFNLNGEPIVCTPKDAIRTFFSCGMDILVLGNFIIKK